MKKKIINILIITMLCVLSPIKIKANNNAFYAITVLDPEIEQYVFDNVSVFMNAHYGSNNNEFELGSGIKIFGRENQNTMIFPVWKNDTIIATFIVNDEYGEICSVYSEAYVDQLNFIKHYASYTNPMCIFAKDNNIYAIIGNKWFDLNGEVGTIVAENTYSISKKVIIINAFDKLDYITYVQPRIATSYSKNFTIYQRQTGSYCYSYALGNILMNMGYLSYTPSNIQSYMNYSDGASKSDMANYLSSKGLSCNYSNSGYLSFDDVMSIIYYNNCYIYIGAKSNNRNESHAFVIFGYYNNGNTQLYNCWNPWYSYKQTMSGSNRIINTETSETFTWNNGYLYNIK